MTFKKATTTRISVIPFIFVIYLLCPLVLYAETIQFIYIEAGEGNASGGHFAAQFGEDIYHYQYDDGLIRLFKNNADAFRADYRLRQNRGLNVADVEVSAETYHQLEGSFQVEQFRQKQKLEHLQALQQDQILLQALLDRQIGKPLNLPTSSEGALKLSGAGLFFEDKESASQHSTEKCDTAVSSARAFAQTKRAIAADFGANFLEEKANTLIARIKQLTPTTNPADAASYQYAFSEQYRDLLKGLLAVQVLQENRPLAASACFSLYFPEMRLDNREIEQATAFRLSLYRTVRSLLNSKRPDWGYALFVTLARLIALEETIQQRRWTFLNDEEDSPFVIRKEDLMRYRENMLGRRRKDQSDLIDKVVQLKKEANAFEPDYVKLEIAANRYRHWLESDRDGHLKYRSEQPLPQFSMAITRFNRYLMTDLTPDQIKAALIERKRLAQRLVEEDNRQHVYNLLDNNCVSAIFGLINRSVAGQSNRLLGGIIDPKTHIVPFQAFAAIMDVYKVSKTEHLPAYRQVQLDKLYRQENDVLVYLRESNVLTSSLYNYNPNDAWFVFFTDDAILPRPFFGVVNTMAATSQTVYGLLSWPFIGGQEVKIGLRGVLSSLPELVFFNIRKGSYPYPLNP